VDDPCRGDWASCCLNRWPIWNKLLKLLRPAVEVEVRPLPPLTKGGVGGVSSELPLPESTVEDRFRAESGRAKAGDDFVERSEITELVRPSIGCAANAIDVELETAVGPFEGPALGHVP
jgi:hypothetical protein